MKQIVISLTVGLRSLFYVALSLSLTHKQGDAVVKVKGLMLIVKTSLRKALMFDPADAQDPYHHPHHYHTNPKQSELSRRVTPVLYTVLIIRRWGGGKAS